MTWLKRVCLSPAEAQALLDALDTLAGAGLTPVTADLEVLARAQAKLEKVAGEH